MRSSHGQRGGRAHLIAFSCFAALFLLALVSRVWVTDDAYITFRTIDNFVNGFGLRWNIDERVQTYTHPLWMLLQIPLYWAIRDPYYTSVALSLIVGAGTFLFLARRLAHSPALFFCCFLAPLLASKAYLDYSNSGLENPLTFLLTAVFAFRLMEVGSGIPWLGLSLVAGLAAVNRLDSIVLVLPALAVLIVSERRKVRWIRVAIGFAPLAIWELFSLFYYGFLVPNTKYSKLDGGFPLLQMLEQGVLYVQDLFRRDLPTGAGIVIGIAATLCCGYRFARDPRDDRSGRCAALGLGVILYCAYVVYIGGDYMSGRFFAAPYLLSLIVTYFFLTGFAPRRRRWMSMAFVGAIAVSFAVSAYVRADARAERRWSRATQIDDQRDLIWYREMSLFSNPVVSNRRAQEGRKYRTMALASGDGRLVVRGWIIGVRGFYAGPEVILLDGLGIGDPLLARLPAATFRIGHFRRDFPAGYLRARRTGSAEGMEPSLAAYYQKLRLITSGPLLSFERLVEIVRFNLGARDPLLERYLRKSASERSRKAKPRPATGSR